MTEDQAEVAALGWRVPLADEHCEKPNAEYWFVVEDWAIPDAHRLCERGWLNRRIRADVEWRLTDRGLYSLRTDALRSAVT
jgi:hypothetical protein